MAVVRGERTVTISGNGHMSAAELALYAEGEGKQYPTQFVIAMHYLYESEINAHKLTIRLTDEAYPGQMDPPPKGDPELYSFDGSTVRYGHSKMSIATVVEIITTGPRYMIQWHSGAEDLSKMYGACFNTEQDAANHVIENATGWFLK